MKRSAARAVDVSRETCRSAEVHRAARARCAERHELGRAAGRTLGAPGARSPTEHAPTTVHDPRRGRRRARRRLAVRARRPGESARRGGSPTSARARACRASRSRPRCPDAQRRRSWRARAASAAFIERDRRGAWAGERRRSSHARAEEWPDGIGALRRRHRPRARPAAGAVRVRGAAARARAARSSPGRAPSTPSEAADGRRGGASSGPRAGRARAPCDPIAGARDHTLHLFRRSRPRRAVPAPAGHGDETARCPRRLMRAGLEHFRAKRPFGRRIRRAPPLASSAQMGTVYAIANQKGGVGKTTTAVNVAACIAEAGYETLLVDVDPQGNATVGLGVARDGGPGPLRRPRRRRRRRGRACAPTPIEHLSILASHAGPRRRERWSCRALPGSENRLRDALAPIRDRYAFILLDCPPSLGPLTVNALVAADRVIVPVQTEYFALEGLAGLLDTLVARPARAQPAADGGRDAADDARRAHAARPGRRARGARALPVARLRHRHPAQRPPRRGAELRRARSSTTTRTAPARRPTSSSPRRWRPVAERTPRHGPRPRRDPASTVPADERGEREPELRELPVELIAPNPHQPRRHFDEEALRRAGRLAARARRAAARARAARRRAGPTSSSPASAAGAPRSSPASRASPRSCARTTTRRRSSSR